MATCIVVDSTCDLEDAFWEEHDIQMAPLLVHIEDKEYRDKVDIQVEEVHAFMRSGGFPRSSQVTAATFMEIFEAAAHKGQDILYIGFSSKLSGTYQTAVMVGTQIAASAGNIRFEAVDSKGGAAAIGILVQQAVRFRSAGLAIGENAQRLRGLADHVQHIFSLSDLDWLVKGGRLSKAGAIVGKTLNIRPILHLNDGVIEVFDKARGEKKTYKKIIEAFLSRVGTLTDQTIALAYTGDRAAMEKLEALINAEIGEREYVRTPIGSVLTAYLGLTGFGVFFFDEGAKPYLELDK